MKAFNKLALISFIGLLACKPQAPSGLSLVNGKLDDQGYFASVGLLETLNSNTPLGVCTASIISTSALLTAAHCVRSNSSTSVTALSANFTIDGKTFKGGRPISHPAYQSNSQVLSGPDVAVVVFPKGTFKNQEIIAVAKGSNSYPKKGLEIMLVGLGKTDQFDHKSMDKKTRYGTNWLTKVSDYLSFTGQTKTTTADGSNAFNSQGDSGGPMFAYEGPSKGKIIGVSSFQNAVKAGDQTGQGNYANLLEESTEAFLAKYAVGGKALDLPDLEHEPSQSSNENGYVENSDEYNQNNQGNSYAFTCPDGSAPISGDAQNGYECRKS